MKRRTLALAALLLASTSAPLAAQTGASPPPVSRAEVARFADALLRRKYRTDAPGGVVLVARGDTVLYRGARGEADVEKNLPLRTDSLFRIGSVTKQFAAAGVLKLVEAGKVKLDDPLTKYVPGFPGGDGITVLQLLNHTAGVRDYTRIKDYMVGPPIQRDLTTAHLIDVFKNEPATFAPGSKWDYSNSGYVLVGAIIEAASGEPWHAYLERALFRPLGMTNTGYAADPKRVARQVRPYSYDKDKLVPARPISMTQPHAAGSLLSTADDLFKWNRALHEGRVLNNANYAQMITPAGSAKEVGYGFGLYREKLRTFPMLTHGGGIFGFISALNYVPGPDISVVVLENDDQDDDRRGGESADTVARRLAAMALGDPYPALKAMAVDAAALQAAEGTYRFDGDVIRILRVVEGKLTAQRGSRGDAVPLTPIAGDDFLYPDGFNRLKLERDASGKVMAARIFPNGDGAGEVGVRAEPLAATVTPVTRARLERLVGTYAHAEAALTMKVFFEGMALLAQLAGQPPVTLRPRSPTDFDTEESNASVHFPAGAMPAAEATMRQGGREITLKRVP